MTAINKFNYISKMQLRAMNYFYLLLFLCFSQILFSQEFAYQPSLSVMESEREFQNLMEDQLEIDLLELQNNKRLTQLYTNRSTYIINMAIKEREYIFNTPLNAYVQTIFENIKAANTEIDANKTRLFVSRALAPNASNFGEGTMVVNIGLLRRMENESQVAFIIGHELAHLQLNHMNQAIARILKGESSKPDIEFRQKFKQNKAHQQLLINIPYNSNFHSPHNEIEADNLALQFISKAGYDVAEAVRALQILHTVDEEKYTANIDIQAEFNRELYPFQAAWLESENPLSAFFEKDEQSTAEISKENYQTHPQPLQRAMQLKEQLANYPPGNINIQPVSAHDRAITQADFDYVLSAYHYKMYGYAIYQALQLEQHYPEHAFLVGIIGACMGEMVDAIDDHEQGILLDHRSPEYSENYNLLLTFLNNLSMNEMANVSYQYVRTYRDIAKENEALAYALALTADVKGRNDQRNNFKHIYKNNFLNGYFYKQVTRI